MKDVYQVIEKVMLTEKGTRLSEEANQYLFRVNPNANKMEIKNAVEKLYSVKVATENTRTPKAKNKRARTAQAGKTADWKRAVVTLAEGNSIDVL
jgi:large subunit ribosomal protein L23